LTVRRNGKYFAIIAEDDGTRSMRAADIARNASKGGRSEEHLWMVALYEVEERTAELLDRLAALGIDTSEASIVRVELNQTAEAAKPFPSIAPIPPKSVAPTARNSITGGVLGSVAGLLAGIFVYASDTFRLPLPDRMFPYAFVSALFGGLLGGACGAIWSALRRNGQANEMIPRIPPDRDGFLVAVKMRPQMAEQAEEIARRLGAKEVLL
jgi:hypothetical protein